MINYKVRQNMDLEHLEEPKDQDYGVFNQESQV
jgi:hypothetical protein